MNHITLLRALQSAIIDYAAGGERRHGVRLAPRAEPPIAAI